MHEWLWCPGCREVSAFEVPPCADGHGGDCPDRACVACGLAVVAGLLPEVAAGAGPAALATSAA